MTFREQCAIEAFKVFMTAAQGVRRDTTAVEVAKRAFDIADAMEAERARRWIDRDTKPETDAMEAERLKREPACVGGSECPGCVRMDP